MYFNPQYFLELAKQLYTDQDYEHINEAAFRTAISRAYYATFLIFREKIRNRLKNTSLMEKFNEVSEKGVAHACIKKIIKRTEGFLGEMYSRLLLLRKISDYELNVTIMDKDAEEAVEIAAELIKFSEQIRERIKINQISNIIDLYYNKIRK